MLLPFGGNDLVVKTMLRQSLRIVKVSLESEVVEPLIRTKVVTALGSIIGSPGSEIVMRKCDAQKR